MYADKSKTWSRKRWVTITLSPGSTRHFTVRTSICQGGLSGVTWPMGRLRPSAGHDPPSPGPCSRRECPFHCPRLPSSVCWAVSLPQVRPHRAGSGTFTLALPSLSPSPSPAWLQVAVFAQECWPALRSQETSRRPWVCLGTCHPFAGPVGDPRFVW